MFQCSLVDFILQHKALLLIGVLKLFEINAIAPVVTTDLETQLFLNSNSTVAIN